MIKTRLLKNNIFQEFKNYTNNVALITGGTRGVGYEIVERMIQLNIPTLFTGRNEKEIKEIEKGK